MTDRRRPRAPLASDPPSSGPMHATRRGFLRASLGGVAGTALVGAGGVAAWATAARVRWAPGAAHPEADATLRIDAPGAVDGASARVVFEVTTPREVLRWAAPPATFRDGVALVTAPLAYPYDRRVPGEYTYRAYALLPGHVAATPEALAYRVRAIAWFA